MKVGGGDGLMTYRVTIVNDEGELLDMISIDGYDLTRSDHRRLLGERITEGMGDRAVRDCASRPVSQDD